jgi:hypothetical protein
MSSDKQGNDDVCVEPVTVSKLSVSYPEGLSLAVPSRLANPIGNAATGPGAALGSEEPLTTDPRIGVAARIFPPVVVVAIDTPARLWLFARFKWEHRRVLTQVSDPFDPYNGSAGAARFGRDGHRSEWCLVHGRSPDAIQ